MVRTKARRRVRIDDAERPAYTSTGPELVPTDDPDWVRPEDDGGWADDPDEGDDGERRSLDLEPRAPVPTFAVQHRGGSSGHEAADQSPFGLTLDETYGEGHRDAVSIVDSAGAALREDLSGEDATQWLRENDGRKMAAGIAAEIQAEADARGLSIDDMKRAVSKRGGRPSADRLALRTRARNALAGMYEDGRSRTLIADVLGCSRPTLYHLMKPAG